MTFRLLIKSIGFDQKVQHSHSISAYTGLSSPARLSNAAHTRFRERTVFAAAPSSEYRIGAESVGETPACQRQVLMGLSLKHR